METLSTFLETLDEGGKSYYELVVLMDGYAGGRSFTLRTTAVLALIDFLKALRLYADRCRHTGFEEGQGGQPVEREKNFSVEEFFPKTSGKST